ncbi:MAG: OBG GTPase family GTP-binding protein [Thermoplasmatota archaeon]|jgi:small GTP-binding protein
METESIEKQIKEIEDEIFNTQKNKATEHHIGKLKAKLAKLKDEIEKRRSASCKGKGFAIKKSGDATVGLIGFPNIGKSTLLNLITDAKSRIGDYDFTTVNAIPGMMNYNGAKIQILDLPGLIAGASEGKGRGREVISAVRNVDLVLFMIDAQFEDTIDIMNQELYKAGIRLNQKKPDVVIKKTGKGGINVTLPVKQTFMDESLIKTIASEYFINADIIVRDNITEDQLIDVFTGNRVYVPAIVVINKIDLVSEKELQKKINNIKQRGWKTVAISALNGTGINKLKEMIFSELNFIRVYMKPVGKQADFNEPLILKKGSTIEQACVKLHKDFKRKFRYASVSGPSAKHTVQKVGLDHVLEDGDVLTIIISR